MEGAEGVPGEGPVSGGPIGRALTAKQFWQLMERWSVSDAMALQLIGFAGKAGKSGKRPRFRFLPVHLRATNYLAEIDASLTTIGETARWLHKKTQALGGKTPIDLMVSEGNGGMEKVLRVLHRLALRSSLKS